MSKALYTLKVTLLLLPQITSLPWYNRKKQLEKMSFFIIFFTFSRGSLPPPILFAMYITYWYYLNTFWTQKF